MMNTMIEWVTVGPIESRSLSQLTKPVASPPSITHTRTHTHEWREGRGGVDAPRVSQSQQGGGRLPDEPWLISSDICIWQQGPPGVPGGGTTELAGSTYKTQRLDHQPSRKVVNLTG